MAGAVIERDRGARERAIVPAADGDVVVRLGSAQNGGAVIVPIPAGVGRPTDGGTGGIDILGRGRGRERRDGDGGALRTADAGGDGKLRIAVERAEGCLDRVVARIQGEA